MANAFATWNPSFSFFSLLREDTLSIEQIRQVLVSFRYYSKFRMPYYSEIVGFSFFSLLPQ